MAEKLAETRGIPKKSLKYIQIWIWNVIDLPYFWRLQGTLPRNDQTIWMCLQKTL